MRAAKAALTQAQAEETDAVAQLKRNQDLLAKSFVSAASVDTAKARADRAIAARRQRQGDHRRRRGERAQFAGRRSTTR